MSSSQTPPVESASEDKWWVVKSGKHHGPFSKAKIATEIRAGKIKLTTLICGVGGETWVPAGEAKEFKGDFENVPPLGNPKAKVFSDSSGDIVFRIKAPTVSVTSIDTLKSIFRYLLIGEIVLCVLAILLWSIGNVIFQGVYPVVEPAEWVVISIGIFSIFYLVVLLPIAIFAWIGLFSFKNWARWLHIVLFVVGNLTSLLVTVASYEPSWRVVDLTFSLASTCTGAIIALSFLSPLSQCFKNDEANDAPEDEE